MGIDGFIIYHYSCSIGSGYFAFFPFLHICFWCSTAEVVGCIVSTQNERLKSLAEFVKTPIISGFHFVRHRVSARWKIQRYIPMPCDVSLRN